MELSSENSLCKLTLYELPQISEGGRDSIFNPTNFLAIYNRTFYIKQGAQRVWGEMNLVQMLNHLKVSTGSAINLYQLKDESSFLWRTIIKFVVLRVLKKLPKNAKAAEGFKIEMNNVLDFETERRQALCVLKKAYSSTNNTFLHPLFGQMTRTEWGRLVYRHFDHHLRQFNS